MSYALFTWFMDQKTRAEKDWINPVSQRNNQGSPMEEIRFPEIAWKLPSKTESVGLIKDKLRIRNYELRIWALMTTWIKS
ncbi:MAG: hypothetical protein ABJG78_06985 [Cyclobacteriaceae bacterium]